MQRDQVVVTIIKRLLTITTGNGHPFSISNVFRNPETEPEVSRMPCSNIFEFPEITLGDSKRGGSVPPIYTKEFQIVVEHWYSSASRGVRVRDIYYYLKAAREVLFSDGLTLGGICRYFAETEVSRIYAPSIGNNVVGIGQVFLVRYIEDFSNL